MFVHHTQHHVLTQHISTNTSYQLSDTVVGCFSATGSGQLAVWVSHEVQQQKLGWNTTGQWSQAISINVPVKIQTLCIALLRAQKLQWSNTVKQSRSNFLLKSYRKCLIWAIAAKGGSTSYWIMGFTFLGTAQSPEKTFLFSRLCLQMCLQTALNVTEQQLNSIFMWVLTFFISST